MGKAIIKLIKPNLSWCYAELGNIDYQANQAEYYSISDMEKLSSSLVVLAEIFDEVAEISRKVCCYLVIILAEYNIEWKT